MTVRLQPVEPVALVGERRPLPSDDRALAALMRAAYCGTPDERDVSEPLDEVRKTLAGEYGPFLAQCSRVIERDGEVVSAILVTRWQDRPLIAFAMTAPSWKRRGLARAGMINTMRDVLASGDDLLSLVVTVENEAAYSLYRDLGFEQGR